MQKITIGGMNLKGVSQQEANRIIYVNEAVGYFASDPQKLGELIIGAQLTKSIDIRLGAKMEIVSSTIQEESDKFKGTLTDYDRRAERFTGPWK